MYDAGPAGLDGSCATEQNKVRYQRVVYERVHSGFPHMPRGRHGSWRQGDAILIIDVEYIEGVPPSPIGLIPSLANPQPPPATAVDM